MALYLVEHTPRAAPEEGVRPPTKLRELAQASRGAEWGPRWLKTWSPDLHDDRQFTLWDAASGDDVRAAMAEYGFLDDMDATPMRVREWGPDDVLASE